MVDAQADIRCLLRTRNSTSYTTSSGRDKFWLKSNETIPEGKSSCAMSLNQLETLMSPKAKEYRLAASFI